MKTWFRTLLVALSSILLVTTLVACGDDDDDDNGGAGSNDLEETIESMCQFYDDCEIVEYDECISEESDEGESVSAACENAVITYYDCATALTCDEYEEIYSQGEHCGDELNALFDACSDDGGNGGGNGPGEDVAAAVCDQMISCELVGSDSRQMCISEHTGFYSEAQSAGADCLDAVLTADQCLADSTCEELSTTGPDCEAEFDAEQAACPW